MLPFLSRGNSFLKLKEFFDDINDPKTFSPTSTEFIRLSAVTIEDTNLSFPFYSMPAEYCIL
jgi:hypothetical protein